jgi:hypothetical protein
MTLGIGGANAGPLPATGPQNCNTASGGSCTFVPSHPTARANGYINANNGAFTISVDSTTAKPCVLAKSTSSLPSNPGSDPGTVSSTAPDPVTGKTTITYSNASGKPSINGLMFTMDGTCTYTLSVTTGSGFVSAGQAD